MFGIFEMECGVGFGISTWGFWCLLWNVSKFEVGCCIVGVSYYTMCRNPSLGLVTKARACDGTGQK